MITHEKLQKTLKTEIIMKSTRSAVLAAKVANKECETADFARYRIYLAFSVRQGVQSK